MGWNCLSQLQLMTSSQTNPERKSIDSECCRPVCVPSTRFKLPLPINLQRLKERSVRGLRVSVAIEEQRGGGGAPRGVVSDAPAGDTDTVADVKAGVLGLLVVGGRGTGNVELGDGALRSGGAESLHGVLDVVGTRPAVAVLKVLEDI